MLRAGRLDALTAVDTSIYFMVKQMGISREEFGQPYIFDRRHIYLQVSNQIATPAKVQQLRG